ncbi:MAG TPA: DUF3014 domain-containing protein [Burkholderiales bacterium]
MEQWSARDDNPYVRRPEPSSSPWWLWVLMIVLLGAGAGYYFWQQDRPLLSQQPEPIAVPEPRAEAPKDEEEPVVRYPVPAAAEESPAKPLPTLENSDPMMRESASALVGRKAFEAMVRPTQLIRNVVATVDNLPRETAPTRVMPLEPVPGRFTPEAKNTARYAPYVRVLESLDTRALVQRYIEAYPLFQQAYAELGFPKRNFNDRLVEAIDNLLAAPELAAPPELVQPKVLYEFADEDLQKRSSGQKIMMRMGADNARRVKAKLREIRRELVAQR